MCSPVVGLAVGALQAVVSYQAQQADYQAQREQYRANYQNALAASRDEQQSLTLRAVQEGDATAEKMHLENIEEAKNLGAAHVAAAGSGVSGLSVDAILRDVSSVAAQNRQTEQLNYENTIAQIEQEQKATNTRAISRINSVPNPTKPSPFGAILGVAGAGAKYFGSTM